MYMQRTAKSLSFSTRAGAFIRGIARKGPLIEIAMKGLSSNIPEHDAGQYAKRVISKSGPAELGQMLASGQIKSRKAQEVMANSLLRACTVSGANEIFARIAEKALSSGNVDSIEAQELLASALMIVVTSRADDGKGVSGEAFNIWRSGKVASEKAKEHLAWCIKNNGSALQAAKAFGLGPLGAVAQMYLAAKISSEGDAALAYEALLSANAEFGEAQKMLASLILRDGTPAMARTALMCDVVSDSEAVVLLKQALKG